MGMLWEIFQEYQLSKRAKGDVAANLEQRVSDLEAEIEFLESLLAQTIPIVEQLSGTDIETEHFPST
ncbi:hypothetical protein JNM87_06965 [Candidatus Saccharibacteria bacterium]|nr:hypothetical protein [Candidatus Saccharibacteria bacterium]